MSLKAVSFSVGCLLSWLVLPMLVLGGGLALLTYAVFAEISAFVMGRDNAIKPSAAREMARRLCVG
jgi:hypothetical protein